jgi:hypothetical protein
MEALGSGPIRKMITSVSDDAQVSYELPIGEDRVPMNALLGRTIQLIYGGEIRCVACDRRTSKSYNQGHCFVCLRRLASCDTCIIKPEQCHYDQGTCREPVWGETHCLIAHTVYLANTGALKVGITRGGNEPVRWVDQGATQAIPIRTVPNRLSSGQLEVALKAFVADRTNWRVMLSGVPEALDMEAARETILGKIDADCMLGEPAQAPARQFRYPVLAYPEKVRSLNLDKAPIVEGTLQGIKGQYLILDTGVINMRKYGGYSLALSAS